MPKCNFCKKEAGYRLERIYYCKEHLEPSVKEQIKKMEEGERKKV
jgi:hypothetical protein